MGITQSIYDWLGRRLDGDKVSDVPVEGGEGGVSRNAASVYFKAAAIDTAMSYIAGAISKCEFKVIIDGQIEQNRLYYLLNVRPNPNQCASQMWQQLVYRLLYTGEGLIVPVRDSLYCANGWGRERRFLREDKIESVSVEDEQLRKTFYSGGCVYLKHGNTRISSLVSGLYDDYRQLMGIAMDGFKRHAGSKYKLTLDYGPPGTRKDEQAQIKERMDPKAQLRAFVDSANSVYFQTQGQTLEQMPLSGVQASEVIEMRKEIFEVVAGIFKIPPPMLFGNMTNMGDLVNVFLTYAVDPIAKQLSDELTSKFFTEFEWLNGCGVRVDTSRVNHIDIFEIATSISALLGSGFSIDEIRGALDWPLLDTEEANKHLVTRNFGVLDEVLRQIAEGGENK